MTAIRPRSCWSRSIRPWTTASSGTTGPNPSAATGFPCPGQCGTTWCSRRESGDVAFFVRDVLGHGRSGVVDEAELCVRERGRRIQLKFGSVGASSPVQQEPVRSCVRDGLRFMEQEEFSADIPSHVLVALRSTPVRRFDRLALHVRARPPSCKRSTLHVFSIDFMQQSACVGPLPNVLIYRRSSPAPCPGPGSSVCFAQPAGPVRSNERPEPVQRLRRGTVAWSTTSASRHLVTTRLVTALVEAPCVIRVCRRLGRRKAPCNAVSRRGPRPPSASPHGATAAATSDFHSLSRAPHRSPPHPRVTAATTDSGCRNDRCPGAMTE